MRRTDREQTTEQAWALMQRGEYGILSLADGSGNPYGVPLSYAADQEAECLYFHGAPVGAKLAWMQENSKASFVVVGDTKVLPDFSILYESAIARGRVERVEEPSEKSKGLMLLAQKYCPESMDKASAYVKNRFESVLVLRFDVRFLSGKANRGV